MNFAYFFKNFSWNDKEVDWLSGYIISLSESESPLILSLCLVVALTDSRIELIDAQLSMHANSIVAVLTVQQTHFVVQFDKIITQNL